LPTLPKSERLCLKKDIGLLFEEGEKWHGYPFRVLMRQEKGTDETSSATMLVSVAKRNFKHATDRNRLKRQIREAYRLNKEILFRHFLNRPSENGSIHIHIGFIYTAKTMETWDVIQKRMIRLLHEIAEKAI
jgi:ribonuclease P protein component